MLLAWSKFFPSALQHLEEGQGKGLQAEILVLWQQSGSGLSSFLLPVARTFRPSCLPPPAAPAYHPPQATDRASGGRSGVVQDGESAQQTWRKAPIFCFYCTSWLRSPALSNGLQSEMLLKFKPRTCCCVPGSRRGGVWLCGLF